MVAKRGRGRPRNEDDADLEKIQDYLKLNSLGYIRRLERIANKCYTIGMKSPGIFGKQIKMAADIYIKLTDAAGVKPREALVSINNNQNTLNAGSQPIDFLTIASKVQEAKKQIGSPAIRTIESDVEQPS
jgi:hypothetical protein